MKQDKNNKTNHVERKENTMKKTREKRLKEILKAHTHVVDNKTQFVYKSNGGVEFTERRGQYKSEVTRAIVQDLIKMCVLYEDIRDEILKIATNVRKIDDNICRIMDDYKANRDLIEFGPDFAGKTLADIKAIELKITDIDNPKLKELLILLAIRIFYTFKFNIFFRLNRDIDDFELKATAQMFDSKGDTKISGPSDKDVKTIRKIIDCERGFLKLYLLTDFNSAEEKDAFGYIERLDLLTKIISENKTDEFLKLMEK